MLYIEIEKALQSSFPSSDIQIAQNENGHTQISIITDQFDNLPKVKRQQQVYKVIQPWITDGSIHAVHLKLETAAEAATEK